MKNIFISICRLFPTSILLLAVFNSNGQTLTRGPYLQVGTQDSITIRWRTSTACNSKITWGTSFGTYPNSFVDLATTTEHIIRIGGLNADTKYWYTIGTSTITLQSANTNYFLTLPPENSSRKLRFMALGDCGNASANQIAVKNTFLNYIGSNDVDALLLLGDNAYNSGLDAEFQTNFFDIYKDDLLKNIKLYPAPGNHDYGNNTANTGKTGTTPALSMPYHLNFSVPMSGEIGGVPSGAKNYYSYNIGNVHLISLDSYGKDDANTTAMYDTAGTQATWLKADLAANTKKWTIAYFHHPPYTKNSHNSDTEMDLVAIREKFVRILERNGVDIILCGHSHGYERSYLLKQYYNTYASPILETGFNASIHTATGTTQNAKYDGSANACPYTYNAGNFNHGTVYVVSGSAGALGGTTAGYPHNCMYYANPTNGGCTYIEVDSNRLTLKFISYTTAPTPVIRDQFTIFKDVNKSQNINAGINEPITLTASWRGTYYWPNNGGATTQSVTINNPATGNFNYTVTDGATGNCLKDAFQVTVSTPIPVLLTDFSANINKEEVWLNWTTSQELQNNYFSIEKSIDGIQFNFLGKIRGSSNSTTNKYYKLIDRAPIVGYNYYRLSQTNIDGHTQIFETKTVKYSGRPGFSINAINSSNNVVELLIKTDRSEQVALTITDMLGKKISVEKLSLSAGVNKKSISLEPGVYVADLGSRQGQRWIKKLLVQ